ncbi:transmembrane protein 256 homolog isoform X7 [Vitis riparia]|uniref:transmembrane protein 256 homolog isoform X7 n=1 Tax=Vitis riparia TaxID=96939 RepID=UPI00155B2E0B|nr:transmembrane protein 256 homolog isoform X7 [Vitis riparia]
MMAAESMMAKLYPWHQVAAVSGAVGIGLGAFGAHVFKPQNPIYKEVWKTASLYHLVHTAALLATPVTKHPILCYTVAYFEDRKYNFLAPFGGLAFIAAWGSLLF